MSPGTTTFTTMISPEKTCLLLIPVKYGVLGHYVELKVYILVFQAVFSLSVVVSERTK